MIDLSHPLEHGIATYPDFPTPHMSHHITFEQSKAEIAEGREFAIDLLTFIGGSSTYIDAPRHMNSRGGDIASLPLERLVARRAVVVPAPSDGRREFMPEDFEGLNLADAAVLLHTGWDKFWGTPKYATGSPYLGPAAARLLTDRSVAMVGIDAILIDNIDDPLSRPQRDAHVTLLGSGIPIIENLRGLGKIPAEGFDVTAVPVAVRNVGSFPVRAFAHESRE